MKNRGQMTKTLNFILLLLSFNAFAQPIPLSTKANGKSYPLIESNPLYQFALNKKNVVQEKFTVSLEALKKYYNYETGGIITFNEAQFPLLNLDGNITTDEKTNLTFMVNLKRRLVSPTKVYMPDSISELFIVNPVSFADAFGAADFLTAKEYYYESIEFNKRKLRYVNSILALEDWRSLIHPPVKNLGSDLSVWDQDYVSLDYEKVNSPFYDTDFQKEIDKITDSELTFKNELQLLADGLAYQRKVALAKKAKDHIFIAVMSFFCDKTSQLLEEILVEKAQSGVDVKIMVEKVWTKIMMKKCMNRMKRAGVDVIMANDLLKKGDKKGLFHEKFMIVDNEEAIQGGSNIVESDNISTGFNHLNRDNDVYVRGPLVTDMKREFIRMWKKFETPKIIEKKNKQNPNRRRIEFYDSLVENQLKLERAQGLRGVDLYPLILLDPSKRDAGVCRFFTQDPTIDKFRLTKAFNALIDKAQERLNMTTGSIYFGLPTDSEKEKKRQTWNKKLFEHIFATTQRGVKLSVIGNGIDGGYGELSNSLNRSLLESKYKFEPLKKLFYKGVADLANKLAAKKNQPYLEYIQKLPHARAWSNFQYMHAKLIHIDRLLSIVSSYNLEEWSADKSYESASVCIDRKLNHQMDRSFMKDFVNSVPAASTSDE
jgi:phosphatidylserine/phosphatidylglycerophosphate/cardiolipin synthase-like enzyme